MSIIDYACYSFRFTLLIIIFCGLEWSSICKSLEKSDFLQLDQFGNDFEKMDALDLPPINESIPNPSFNDCHYCQKENRMWYSSTSNLYHASNTCGYDYLELRFDQIFVYNGANVFVQVFCSVDTNTISIDSLIYSQRDQNSSIQKIIPQLKPTTIKINPEAFFNQNVTKKRTVENLKRLVELANFYCSIGEWSKKKNQFKMKFAIKDHRYMLINGHISDSVDGNGTVFRSANCTPVKIYYRLGFHQEPPPCNALESNQASIAFNKIKVKYHLNQCLININVSAENGLSKILFNGIGIHKELTFKGEKQIETSFALGFGERETIVDIEVIDKLGQSSFKEIKLFEKLAKEKEMKKQIYRERNARKNWANQNVINSSLNVISRFEGNIISRIIDMYCENKAQDFLLSIPDSLVKDDFTIIHLPCPGRKPVDVIRNADYLYKFQFVADSINKDINSIEYKGVYINSDGGPKHFQLSGEVPFGSGYYLPKWKIDTSIIDSLHEDQVTILACEKAYIDNGKLNIIRFPLVEKESFDKLNFSLVISDRYLDDSVTLSYAVKYLDRTQDISFQTIDLNDMQNKKDILISTAGFNLSCKTTAVSEDKNERFTILNEVISSKKKIVCLTIFLFSHKFNLTTGITSVWSD